MTDILIELSGLAAPPGFETPAANRVSALFAQYMDETWIDVLGNVVGVRRCGKENAPKLLFDAHIDEPGLIVTGVEEGFLRFSPLGGLDARILPAAEVQILSDPPLFGVICVLPPHIMKPEDTEKTIKIEDMFIDVGLSQEDAEKAVPAGTPGVFANSARRIGDDGLCGKAMDNRAGVTAILHAVELLKDTALDIDLYVMASTQEEVGLRGATTGTFSIDPDYCVIVDVGHAKTPDTKPNEVYTTLGGGVIVSRGPNMNSQFTEKIIRLAAEKDIKHQIDVAPGGSSGTNAQVIQVSRLGVATALFGIPLKYMHSAYESISIDDVENTAQLLCETAKSIKGGGQ